MTQSWDWATQKYRKMSTTIQKYILISIIQRKEQINETNDRELNKIKN